MITSVKRGLPVCTALLAACAMAFAVPVPRQAIAWPFVVAEKSESWVRPTRAQQREVWDSPRFGGPGGRAYYTHDFFLWPEGAAVPEYVDANAGITDADGRPRTAVTTNPALGAWHAPDTGATRGVFPGAAFLGFYSLLHSVERVQVRET